MKHAARANSGLPDEPLHASYFTRRLENFSDIVFGFSISLLALQLDVPKTAADINPWHYLYFFLTFAVLASMWYMHYRMFRFAFAAQPLDVVLNFALLGCVAFLPYSLQLLVRYGNSTLPAILYGIDFGTVYLLTAILNLRGLHHWMRSLSEPLRSRLWRRVLTGTCGRCRRIPPRR